MLFKLLDEVSARIDGINIVAEAPKFAAQLREMRPTIEAELKSNGIAPDQLEKTILALSLTQMRIIKDIPAIAAEMRKMLQDGSGEPAFRCVLAASLAYLVQPHDLMPDDLPAGYGFVDDALLLHEASALSWEIAGDMARAEEKRKLFQFIFIFVPDTNHAAFKNAISGLAMTLGMMRSLDPVLAETTTQMLIANPLQPIMSQSTGGTQSGSSTFGSQFKNYPESSRPQYTWKSGNSMGVNFPDGGGVASDGRDVFVF